MTQETKKIFIMAMAFLSIAFMIISLAGCGVTSLNYQGTVRQTSEVEEMLSDYLESENPNMELNVTITQDTD